MKTRTDLKSGSACYTVQAGDTLNKIAKRFYGDKTTQHVMTLYYSNLKTIGPNMNLLKVGEKLFIPDK